MNNDTPADAMKLKPCPFCGSEKIFANQYVRDGVGISCGDCNTKIYEYHGPPDRPSARERCFTRWNTRAPSLAAQVGLVEALRFYAEEDRYDYDQTCCTYAATKKRRRELEKSGGWVLEDGGEKARAALASIEVKP